MKKLSATARLEQKVKRLSTLIEVNALISSSLNLDQILENVMAISKQVMNADASSQDLPVLLKKLDASVDKLKVFTEKSDKLVGDNKKNIDEMVEHFRDMGKNLKDASEEIKKEPWKLLRKP